MNDIKNIFIAWISTSTSVFAAIELKTVLAILSAVVLPIVFFSIGKTVDVLLQMHFKRREEERGAAATVSTPCGSGGLNANSERSGKVSTPND
jgi:hypothetical protein